MFASSELPWLRSGLYAFLGVRHLEDIGRLFVGGFLLSEGVSFALVGAAVVISRRRK
jgi:hypothetical protein